MTTRRRLAVAVAAGAALFLVACALPRIGLFRSSSGGWPPTEFQSYGDMTVDGKIPYRDFALEYPPGALPAFVVPALGPWDHYPILFMAFEALCGLAVVGLVASILVALRAPPRRLHVGVAFAALAPLALGPLTLHRFDLWPTALLLGGIAGVLWGRDRGGFASLGVGAAAKVFPAAIVPLALVYVARTRGREAVRRGAVAFVVAVVVVVGPFAVLAPGGVASSLERQVQRPLQIETLASSAMLVADRADVYDAHPQFGSGSWNLDGGGEREAAAVQTVLLALGLVFVWWRFWRGRTSGDRLVLAAAAAIAVWLVFGKVLSPQFLLWLVPLVALLVTRARVVGALLLGALVLTQIVYPHEYDALVALHGTPIVLLALRNALLVAVAAALLLALERDRVPEEVGADREREHARHAVLLDRSDGHGPDGVPRLEPRGRE